MINVKRKFWGIFFIGCVSYTYGQNTTDLEALLKKRYDYVFNLETYYSVKKNKKIGVVDKSGKVLVPCKKYTGILEWQIVQGDYCEVAIEDKVGIINKNNKEVIPCGKYGYLNYTPKNSYAIVAKGIEFSGGGSPPITFGDVVKNGKWGIFDLIKKEEIVKCQYDYIGKEQDGIFPFNIGGHLTRNAWDAKGGKWGYMDINGKELIAAQYDNITDFKDGIAQVTKDGVVSLLKHPLVGSNYAMGNAEINIPTDINIPETERHSENTFVFIIANENYNHFAGADCSINDGKIFSKYCQKTMGIPERNIRYYEDATYGNMVSAVKKLQDIADVYDGDAKIIFYYSGLGATDEQSHEKYLLAADASLSALSSTGYKVSDILCTLKSLNVVYTWVIIDAPFSNTDKNGKNLTSSRGISAKSKVVSPEGNVIISLSCDDIQTAYSSRQFGHSLFTYSLLYKIQQTKGSCTIKDLLDFSKDWVKKTSIEKFDKTQNPVITVSDKINSIWGKLKL